MRKIRLRPVGLKHFQQATVDYTFRRLFRDDDCVDRFLIADEVGLGKTLCARGLLARTGDSHRWRSMSAEAPCDKNGWG